MVPIQSDAANDATSPGVGLAKGCVVTAVYRCLLEFIEDIVPGRGGAERLLKRSNQLLRPRALKPLLNRGTHRTRCLLFEPLFKMSSNVLFEPRAIVGLAASPKITGLQQYGAADLLRNCSGRDKKTLARA
jgi:hypothetical protein